MAMLAEPRKRQKWSLNPRGNDWAADDNRFGQKLMEKMGWSKGKGLGRREQGDPDHLSVRFKDDTKGFGYKGKDDEWVKNYTSFENVLATLNSEENSAANSENNSTCNSSANSDNETDRQDKSLESRSRVSRARVHYHKFTRGKDLSNYKKDDIACILGSKRAKVLAERETMEETAGEDEVGHVDHINGVTTVKGCNIQDYFKQKMASLKEKSNMKQQKTEPEQYVENGGNAAESFGFSVEEGDNAVSEPFVYSGESAEESKKRKKKRKREKVVEEEEKENPELMKEQTSKTEAAVVEEEDGDVETEEVARRKKKKKHKNKDIEVEGDCQLSSVSVAPTTDNTRRKKNATIPEDNHLADSELTGLEETHNPQAKKKKKKKKNSSEEDACENNDDANDSVLESLQKVSTGNKDEDEDSGFENNEQETRKKKKKKRKSESPDELIICNNNSSNNNEMDVEAAGHKHKAKKKTKKRKTESSGGVVGSDGEERDLENMECQTKKKKKKKSDTSSEADNNEEERCLEKAERETETKKRKSESLPREIDCNTEDNQSLENTKEKTKEKNKKPESSPEEINHNDGGDVVAEVTEQETKKKKKKKKKPELMTGGMSQNNNTEEFSGEILNRVSDADEAIVESAEQEIPRDAVKKKKKKKNKDGKVRLANDMAASKNRSGGETEGNVNEHRDHVLNDNTEVSVCGRGEASEGRLLGKPEKRERSVVKEFVAQDCTTESGDDADKTRDRLGVSCINFEVPCAFPEKPKSVKLPSSHGTRSLKVNIGSLKATSEALKNTMATGKPAIRNTETLSGDRNMKFETKKWENKSRHQQQTVRRGMTDITLTSSRYGNPERGVKTKSWKSKSPQPRQTARRGGNNAAQTRPRQSDRKREVGKGNETDESEHEQQRSVKRRRRSKRKPLTKQGLNKMARAFLGTNLNNLEGY